MDADAMYSGIAYLKYGDPLTFIGTLAACAAWADNVTQEEDFQEINIRRVEEPELISCNK